MNRDDLRIYVATKDEGWKDALRSGFHEWSDRQVEFFERGEDLRRLRPQRGMVFLDEGIEDMSAFVLCRQLRSGGRVRIVMMLRSEEATAAPIAKFCGAFATLTFPLQPRTLESLFTEEAPVLPIDEMLREAEMSGEEAIREGVLRDLEQVSTGRLLDWLTDPETKLFNYEFLLFKLDEEFKRASRFKYPLSCVILGFEGEAGEQTLLELAAIFLNESRDTDILGRFDLNSFLFLLPQTGPDGARSMADRIRDSVNRRGLRDLAGDRLDVSMGISFYPHEGITRREHLFERARNVFLEMRNAGGGILTAD